MPNTIKQFTSGARERWSLRTTVILCGIMLFFFMESGSTIEVSDDSRPWNQSVYDKLRMELFVNYDKNAQPTYRGVPSNISIGMSVNYITIDSLNGKMTLHSWLRIRWMDENRTWNSNDYNNITTLHLKAKDVWKPEITLFNSAGKEGDYVGDTQVLIFNQGNCLWVPPAVYTAYCNLNFLLWPYDTQTCKLKIGSWTLTSIDENSLALKESLDYSDIVQSTEWEIIDTKAKYRKKDYYNYAEFTFKLRRRSSMYAAVIFTPASCIILLALATFWLPPQMGEKILLNGVAILVIAAFLMYFAQLLPILAENTPLIVLFYSSSLLLLGLSTTIEVFVLYLSTAKHKRRIPDWLKRLLNGTLGNVLFLTHFTLEAEPNCLINNDTKELNEAVYSDVENEMADPSDINPTPAPSSRSIQFEWILLATALDRIFFLLYCLVFLVLAIVYSV